MTILFFARRFYPDIGGVEKHVYEISRRLVSLGHKVIIVSEQTSKLAKNMLDASTLNSLTSFEIHKIPVSSGEKHKKFEIWQWLWNNRQLIAEADVIHCHDVFFWYIPFRFLYPFKKVFTTFHGYEDYPITRKAIIVRKVSEILSRGNICIGDFIKRWYGTKPDVVSYGAVDLKTSNQTLSTNKESAVFIGRLDDQTGIATYVDVFKLLKKQHPKFRFSVIGDGSFKKYLPKNVSYKPFELHAEKYFANHRFAFVSRYLSILEAMAAKRLVFAVFDNPLKKDYLKLSPMAAFMVIAQTPEEIAEAAEYYLTHPKNEQDHIKKAHDWAKQQTWEKMVSLYLELWQKN